MSERTGEDHGQGQDCGDYHTLFLVESTVCGGVRTAPAAERECGAGGRRRGARDQGRVMGVTGL